MTLHNVRIMPTDHPRAIHRITKRIATNTNWWYILPNESSPRKIVRVGRRGWQCEIPCCDGIQIHADEDFHTILEDLRLSGAIIYNKK